LQVLSISEKFFQLLVWQEVFLVHSEGPGDYLKIAVRFFDIPTIMNLSIADGDPITLHNFTVRIDEFVLKDPTIIDD